MVMACRLLHRKGVMRPQPESAVVTVTVNPVEKDAVRVCVAGEVDMSSAPDLRAALADALGSWPRRRVEVSLAGVRFFDASGVHALLDARRRAARTGRDLVVVAAQPMVCQILRITGTLAVLAPDGLEKAPPSTLDTGGDVRRSDRLGLG
jgi:anti-sigma B factor antagonist